MKFYKYSVIFISILFILFIFNTSFVQAATLALSPSSGAYSLGSIFTVNILLNTESQAVDGVDIRYLNYNPAYLEVQDEDSGTSGIQITAGALFPSTGINSVDTVNGRISFSQIVNPGTTFTNSSPQTLATVRFRVLQTATASVTFNFTLGSTSDTNVASGGSDLLSSVTNGSYTLQDTTPPSAPADLSAAAVSSSQINLSWTASTDNIGVTGYRLERCQGSTCANFSQIATPSGTTYNNTGLSANTTYRYRVRAQDAAGNLSSYSGIVSATTQSPPDTASPAAINNLTVTNVTTSSITVSWTSPGDDGVVGTANFYDLRYSTANVTDANWNSATQVSGEPAPLIAGTGQAMTVTGLAGGTTYYFGIKTSDEASNISALSNIASGATVVLTLNVSLTANPSSGPAPLSGVDLSASVSGTETGNINYTFYCNRSDAGTNITLPYDAKIDNQSAATYNALDVCNYTNSGTYTAKVIVERGSLQDEDRITITVSSPPASTKFSINNRVKTTNTVNVRSTASVSGTLLGTQALNNRGTIVAGPTYADSYWWWQINYDSGVDGWSIEDWLELPPIVSNVIFNVSLEGLSTASGRNFTVSIYYTLTGNQQAQFTAPANASGQVVLPASVTDLREDRNNIYLKSPGYLRSVSSDVLIATGGVITLPLLRAGDFNDDGIINSLDWSPMNQNWFGSDPTADINQDGIVNSVDFSWMNKNWLQSDAS